MRTRVPDAGRRRAVGRTYRWSGTNAQTRDEERRLVYVALTRAKWSLHQLAPQRFYVSGQSGVGDKHVYGLVSRFMPLAVAALCEACGPPRHEAVGNAPPSAMPSTTLDVAARLRDRWV